MMHVIQVLVKEQSFDQDEDRVQVDRSVLSQMLSVPPSPASSAGGARRMRCSSSSQEEAAASAACARTGVPTGSTSPPLALPATAGAACIQPVVAHPRCHDLVGAMQVCICGASALASNKDPRHFWRHASHRQEPAGAFAELCRDC